MYTRPKTRLGKPLKMFLPKHRWIQEIEVGDVLRARSGLLRVVRHVSKRQGGVVWVYFTIKHCSWTRRCYTLYSMNDLIQRGFKPTGKKFPVGEDPFDNLILNEMAFVGSDPPMLTCCDVEGIG